MSRSCLSHYLCRVVLRMIWMMNTMKYKKGETRSHCFLSVIRPPSTATVIGIQSDGESLLEERRGGDAQQGCSGETNHATLHSSALLSHPTGFYRHLQTTDKAHSLRFGVVFHFLTRHWFSDQLSFVTSCSCKKWCRFMKELCGYHTSLMTVRKAKIFLPAF